MSDGRAHSKLGASSYDRWGECPGSVAASEGIPNESSIYAEEGTLAHDWAAFLLTGKNKPQKELTDEMADAINVYAVHIGELRARNPSFESVEQRLDLSEYHPALFGTADYVAYFADTKTLHVVDYKHGRGIPVEVLGSRQLRYYGLGALHMNKFPIECVTLTIVQPRCYHPDGPVRSWVLDAVDMLDFAADLIDDARKTEDPNAPLVPGDHCRFCPAQPTCKAIESQALVSAQASFTNVERFDPRKLAETLTLIPRIKAWCESVNEFAHQQASLGHEIPGFKLVDKRANRRWADGVSANDLAEVFAKPVKNFYGEPKLLSPAQVEKIIPKEDKKRLEPFTVKESSGKTLVPVADDRPKVAGAIESMFNPE